MKKIIAFITLALLGIAGVWYWEEQHKPLAPAEPAETNLKIHFLDVGQGDATLVQFADGQEMLVDCGRDAIVLSALSRVRRWQDRELDYVVVTHPDADHFAGCIDVLQRYRVKKIYLNGFDKERSDLWQSFLDKVREAEIVTSTRRLEIAGAAVEFLYPDHNLANDHRIPGTTKTESNDTSIVMRLEVGEQKILLTGDMEEPLENYLIKKYAANLKARVLKVGHHGSISSSGEKFLQAVGASYCIISVGAGNTYGHPSHRVLSRLERTGCSILRTDELGDILLSITASQIVVKHEKK